MITVSFQFENVDAAAAFLRAVDGPKPQQLPLSEAQGEKRERKPRSDAGQPRGPYKRREETPTDGAPVVEAAAPATVPAETPPAAPEAAAIPVPAAELSIADVRAAMTGRSTEKNIALLKKFGYAKSSDLPQPQYAAFIAACKRGE